MSARETLCESRLRMRDEVLSRWFAHYPEDVFLPLDAAQVGEAVKAIQATGITSDALYGGWARHILFHVMLEIKKADEELLRSSAPNPATDRFLTDRMDEGRGMSSS